MLCKFSDKTINPYFTTDNLQQMLEDNVVTDEMKASMANGDVTNCFGFEDLGIVPTDMAKVSSDYLSRFRSGGHFRKIQGYH